MCQAERESASEHINTVCLAVLTCVCVLLPPCTVPLRAALLKEDGCHCVLPSGLGIEI